MNSRVRDFLKSLQIHGFSLLEITITLGISSFLVLVVQDIMNRTNTIERNANQNMSIQSVVSKIITTLDNIDSCSQTLQSSNPNGLVGTPITFRNRAGDLVFPINNIIGVGNTRVQILDARISHYQDSTSAGHFNGLSQATVTVTLRRGSAIGVDLSTITAVQRARLTVREGTSRLEEVHRFPVRVTVGSGGTVQGCSYGIDSFQTNLERSCEMLGGVLATATCRNLNVQAENSAARKSSAATPITGFTKTPANSSPALYLDGDMEAPGTGSRFYSYEFRMLSHLDNPAVNTLPLSDPAAYAVGLSLGAVDFSSRVLAHGSIALPPLTGPGMVNSDGVILVGDIPNTYAPSPFGLGVGSNIDLGVGRRLTLTDTIPLNATDDRVPSAEWVATAIADTMSDNSTLTIASIANNILGSGTTAARAAILSYMCQQMTITNYNNGGAAGNRSVDFNNSVRGSWNGTQCVFDTRVKSNCSVDNSCDVLSPDELCIDNVCKTRWPYMIKTGSCEWRNSCLSTQRTFGTRNTTHPYHNQLTLCCSVRSSDVRPTP